MNQLTEQQKTNLRSLVAALRGGEYSQGRGQLRHRDEFCCLGVACDLYQKATGNGAWANLDGTQETLHPPYDWGYFPDASNTTWPFSGISPLEVNDYFGLDGSAASLANLNDSGVTFAGIADYLEEKFGLRKNS